MKAASRGGSLKQVLLCFLVRSSNGAFAAAKFLPCRYATESRVLAASRATMQCE